MRLVEKASSLVPTWHSSHQHPPCCSASVHPASVAGAEAGAEALSVAVNVLWHVAAAAGEVLAVAVAPAVTWSILETESPAVVGREVV